MWNHDYDSFFYTKSKIQTNDKGIRNKRLKSSEEPNFRCYTTASRSNRIVPIFNVFSV